MRQNYAWYVYLERGCQAGECSRRLNANGFYAGNTRCYFLCLTDLSVRKYGEGDRKRILRVLVELQDYVRGQGGCGFDSLKEIEGEGC